MLMEIIPEPTLVPEPSSLDAGGVSPPSKMGSMGMEEAKMGMLPMENAGVGAATNSVEGGAGQLGGIVPIGSISGGGMPLARPWRPSLMALLE